MLVDRQVDFAPIPPTSTIELPEAAEKPEIKRKEVVKSGYLHHVLRPEELSEVVDKTVAFIRAKNWEFDAIAFTGISGALVAPTVAYLLQKYPIAVRKVADGRHCHSTMLVEGYAPEKPFNYIVVDDCVATGNTLRRITREMVKTRPNAIPTYVVVYGLDPYEMDLQLYAPGGARDYDI